MEAMSHHDHGVTGGVRHFPSSMPIADHGSGS
jgi:hypothetical protein